jgi:hypothetical protein
MLMIPLSLWAPLLKDFFSLPMISRRIDVVRMELVSLG